MNETRAGAAARRAVVLFGALTAAKLVGVWGREIVGGACAPLLYLWQDATVALLFGLLDAACGRRWLARAALTLLVVHAAVNAAVVRELGSPVTASMWHAFDDALADSIAAHLTVANLGAVALVCGAALALAVAMRRRRVSAWLALPALAIAVSGAALTPSRSTRGLHRNALVAFAASAVPGAPAAEAVGRDWRRSPLGERQGRPSPVASALRGVARGRSVVLVVLESAAAQYLGTRGADRDPMPFLDSLSRQAIVADAAYAVYPESIKGMVALLAGQYPAPHTAPADYAELPAPSLAAVLGAAGYRTALFHSGRFEYLGMDEVLRGQRFAAAFDAADIGGERESSFGVDEAATVAAMLAWLDRRDAAERPFLLTYLPIAGHHPYDSPESGPFPPGTAIDSYRNALHYCDKCLATLWRGISARGLTDDVVLVVVGDHGQAFGQHEANFGHTFRLYDENVRVPLLIAVPGVIAESRRLAEPTSHVDVAPTVLDLLGVRVPSGWDGVSLLEATPRVALFFTDYSLDLVGIRCGEWKAVFEVGAGHGELYSLREDPREASDVAASHRAQVAALGDHARSWWHWLRGRR